MRNALTPAFQFACTVACLLALVASAGPLARGAGHAPAGDRAVMLASAAAQRIYIDLATGQLREPTAAELAAGNQGAAVGLQPSQKQVLPGAVATGDSAAEVHLADGTVGVRPARQYLHTIVLCRQADGSFGEHCATPGSAP